MPAACFLKVKLYWNTATMLISLCIVCGCFYILKARLSNCYRQYSLQNLKYLLFGSLQESLPIPDLDKLDPIHLGPDMGVIVLERKHTVRFILPVDIRIGAAWKKGTRDLNESGELFEPFLNHKSKPKLWKETLNVNIGVFFCTFLCHFLFLHIYLCP